jgi:hypothetical protein
MQNFEQENIELKKRADDLERSLKAMTKAVENLILMHKYPNRVILPLEEN